MTVNTPLILLDFGSSTVKISNLVEHFRLAEDGDFQHKC